MMSISFSFGQMHRFFPNGQMESGEEAMFPANCGDHFNDYVQRTRSQPFPYNPYNGGVMRHTELWNGRRLKIKMYTPEGSSWRDAQVVEWKEYMMGPFSHETRWSLTIEFTGDDDTVDRPLQGRDLVRIHGLKSGGEQHNGSEAFVVGLESDTGRYVVRLKDDADDDYDDDDACDCSTGCGNNEGNNDEGNNDEGNNDEGNNDEGNNDEGNNDEGNNDEGNNDEGNNPDDGDSDDEGNNDEGNNDEGNNDEGNNNDDDGDDDGDHDKGDDDDECKTLAIADENLKLLDRMKFKVHRVNVQGGGVLLTCSDTRLSFKWLEEASPVVNLAEEPWQVTCPSCRKVTTSDQLYEMKSRVKEKKEAGASASGSTECPVCLEVKECQVLPTCSHQVCSPCLARWRKKLDGESFFLPEDIVLTDLSPKDIEKKRKKNTRVLKALGAIPANRMAEENQERVMDILQGTIADIRSNSDGDNAAMYTQFKRWLLINPIELWGPTYFLLELCRSIEIPMAEILIAYVESLRTTEMYKTFARGVLTEGKKFQYDVTVTDRQPSHDAILENLDNFHNLQVHLLCCTLGVKCEEIEDYRSAICWYEKSIQCRYVGDGDTGLGCALNNLGLAQRRASLFQEALKNYMRALFVINDDDESVLRNIQLVQYEIDEWVGSSGYVTPRLDE
jgi:tetratricopeptide (TPR) repeat protein